MATMQSSPSVDARAIPNYEGYLIERDGTVWSSKYGSWRKLVINYNNYYPTVVLCKNNKPKTLTLHSLLLTIFVGAKPDGMVAAHNDGNRFNYSLENLRWDTQKNNIADKKKHGTHLRGTQLPWTKLSEAEVLQIRTVIGTKPLRRIAADFGVSKKTIALIRDRKTWGWL